MICEHLRNFPPVGSPWQSAAAKWVKPGRVLNPDMREPSASMRFCASSPCKNQGDGRDGEGKPTSSQKKCKCLNGGNGTVEGCGNTSHTMMVSLKLLISEL